MVLDSASEANDSWVFCCGTLKAICIAKCVLRAGLTLIYTLGVLIYTLGVLTLTRHICTELQTVRDVGFYQGVLAFSVESSRRRIGAYSNYNVTLAPRLAVRTNDAFFQDFFWWLGG